MEDEFEKTMDGEFEEPTEDDGETGDGASDDSKTAEGKTPQPGDSDSSDGEDEPTLAELSEQIEMLRKESDGRLRDLRSERNKRQQLETKVNTVTDMISKARSAKESRGDATNSDDEGASVQVGAKGIPVSFDDDGNPYIAAEDLKGLTANEAKSVEKKLSEKIEQLEGMSAQSAAQNANAQAVQSVLSKDEAYPGAYRQLVSAFQMLDQGLTDLAERQGLEIDSMEKALDAIEGDKTLMKNFSSQFPGVDIDTVVDAMSLTPNGRVNTRKLQKALNALNPPEEAGGTGSGGIKAGKKGIGTLKAITKARNLAGASNQRGSRETSLDDMASMDFDDFMNLSEGQIAELERTLRDEAEAGM